MSVARLDSHHHFWTLDRVQRGDYPWMPPGLLQEDHLPARLGPELEDTGVAGTIVIQAAENVDETRFLLDLAHRTGFVLGVTGWAPLDDPEGLETLADLAKDDYLLAVRPMIHDKDDRRWIAQPQVRESLRALVSHGVRFEALTRPDYMPAVHEALAAVPELPAVINHLSKPTFRWDDDGQWRTWMTRLAARPGTYCKFSGMLTEVGPHWTDADFEPYAQFIFEAFGEDRVMFGSDWPVSRQLLEYPDVVDLTERLVTSIGVSSTDAFWRRNAEEFYGVHIPEPPR
ncbi:amidohydrolase family protein [Arthrobacter monumenti]